jgi:hypothetical protein
MLNKLEEAKGREKQKEEERRHATKIIVTLSVLTTNFFLTSNPFAKLKVPLLPSKV